jgi:hypothetical protein
MDLARNGVTYAMKLVRRELMAYRSGMKNL